MWNILLIISRSTIVKTIVTDCLRFGYFNCSLITITVTIVDHRSVDYFFPKISTNLVSNEIHVFIRLGVYFPCYELLHLFFSIFVKIAPKLVNTQREWNILRTLPLIRRSTTCRLHHVRPIFSTAAARVPLLIIELLQPLSPAAITPGLQSMRDTSIHPSATPFESFITSPPRPFAFCFAVQLVFILCSVFSRRKSPSLSPPNGDWQFFHVFPFLDFPLFFFLPSRNSQIRNYRAMIGILGN